MLHSLDFINKLKAAFTRFNKLKTAFTRFNKLKDALSRSYKKNVDSLDFTTERLHSLEPQIKTSFSWCYFMNIKHVKIFGKSPGEVVVYPGVFQGKKSASIIHINQRVSVQ